MSRRDPPRLGPAPLQHGYYPKTWRVLWWVWAALWTLVMLLHAATHG